MSKQSCEDFPQENFEMFAKESTMPSVEFNLCLDLFAYRFMQSLKIKFEKNETPSSSLFFKCDFNLKGLGIIMDDDDKKIEYGIYITLMNCAYSFIRLKEVAIEIKDEKVQDENKLLQALIALNSALFALWFIFKRIRPLIFHLLTHVVHIYEEVTPDIDFVATIRVCFDNFQLSCNCCDGDDFDLPMHFYRGFICLLKIQDYLPPPVFRVTYELLTGRLALKDLVFKIGFILGLGKNASTQKKIFEKLAKDEEYTRLFGPLNMCSSDEDDLMSLELAENLSLNPASTEASILSESHDMGATSTNEEDSSESLLANISEGQPQTSISNSRSSNLKLYLDSTSTLPEASILRECETLLEHEIVDQNNLNVENHDMGSINTNEEESSVSLLAKLGNVTPLISVSSYSSSNSKFNLGSTVSSNSSPDSKIYLDSSTSQTDATLMELTQLSLGIMEDSVYSQTAIEEDTTLLECMTQQLTLSELMPGSQNGDFVTVNSSLEDRHSFELDINGNQLQITNIVSLSQDSVNIIDKEENMQSSLVFRYNDSDNFISQSATSTEKSDNESVIIVVLEDIPKQLESLSDVIVAKPENEVQGSAMENVSVLSQKSLVYAEDEHPMCKVAKDETDVVVIENLVGKIMDTVTRDSYTEELSVHGNFLDNIKEPNNSVVKVKSGSSSSSPKLFRADEGSIPETISEGSSIIYTRSNPNDCDDSFEDSEFLLQESESLLDDSDHKQIGSAINVLDNAMTPQTIAKGGARIDPTMDSCKAQVGSYAGNDVLSQPDGSSSSYGTANEHLSGGGDACSLASDVCISQTSTLNSCLNSPSQSCMDQDVTMEETVDESIAKSNPNVLLGEISENFQSPGQLSKLKNRKRKLYFEDQLLMCQPKELSFNTRENNQSQNAVDDVYSPAPKLMFANVVDKFSPSLPSSQCKSLPLKNLKTSPKISRVNSECLSFYESLRNNRIKEIQEKSVDKETDYTIFSSSYSQQKSSRIMDSNISTANSNSVRKRVVLKVLLEKLPTSIDSVFNNMQIEKKKTNLPETVNYCLLENTDGDMVESAKAQNAQPEHSITDSLSFPVCTELNRKESSSSNTNINPNAAGWFSKLPEEKLKKRKTRLIYSSDSTASDEEGIVNKSRFTFLSNKEIDNRKGENKSISSELNRKEPISSNTIINPNKNNPTTNAARWISKLSKEKLKKRKAQLIYSSDSTASDEEGIVNKRKFTFLANNEIDNRDGESSLAKNTVTTKANNPSEMVLKKTEDYIVKMCEDKMKVCKKKWTEEEEELLFVGVQELGESHWLEISKRYGINKGSQQCYDKWRNLMKGNGAELIKVKARVAGKKKKKVAQTVYS